MTLNRIKKLTLYLIVTLISFSNISAQAGVDGSPFEGLYLGVISTKSTFSSTASHVARTDIVDPFSQNVISTFNGISTSTSENSFGGGLMGGYGLNYGLLYFGAEAAFIVDKGNTVLSDGVSTIKISQGNTFDVSLRSGITISDKALVFGLIGYSGVNLKSKGINERLGNNLDFNKRLTSLRYGGGIEVAVMENIAVRAEYTRSIINDAIVLDGADEFTYKPKSSRIMLSLVLHMF